MSEPDERPHGGSSSAPALLPLAEAVHSLVPDDLLRAAADPALTADLALALLRRADLPGEVVEELSKNRSALKGRKVKVAVACHPKTPRHVSVPMIRQFYTFDLMKVALSPVVPADVKHTADEALLARVKTVTLGERLTLARQASGVIASVLLLDPEPRVMQTALENGRLTEVGVVKAVIKPEATPTLIRAVGQHAKWSYRRDVQSALLRSEHLSLARALAFANGLAPSRLREILQTSRLPAKSKDALLRQAQTVPAKPKARA
jgi:hypothetical protein